MPSKLSVVVTTDRLLEATAVFAQSPSTKQPVTPLGGGWKENRPADIVGSQQGSNNELELTLGTFHSFLSWPLW